MSKSKKTATPTDALDPTQEIMKLNKSYCVVTEGGKVRVLTFSKEHGRESVNYLSFTDFRNLHMHKYVAVGKDKSGNAITAPLGSYWLKHSSRRQYTGVTFEPLQPAVVGGKLNLWRGWGIEPKAGDWSLMQQHIFEVLGSGHDVHAEYILNFAAWCVQHPGEPAEVALTFRGPEGSGRGLFGRALCRMFGQHALQVSSIKNLVGDFNKHLRDCCMLFADEAFWPGHRDREGALKRLMTEPTLFIEPKGVDAFEVRNMLHIIMVSNNEWVIPASMDARRFAMFDVAAHHKQDKGWFDPLYQQMDAGGLAAMLHDLLVRDLGDWHPRQIVHTQALRDQQMRSLDTLDPVEAWWFSLLSGGVLPQRPLQEDEQAHNTNPRRAYSTDLYEHARRCVPKLKFDSDIALGRALREHGCTSFNYLGRGWTFPPLDEARAEWNASKMPEHDWHDDLTDWQPRHAMEDPAVQQALADTITETPKPKNGRGRSTRH